ncbi:unnamed protein product (macronuclear) [Paramecium tetraurelia]|uniref:TPX2 central domain-containing protein n=1 Tax=Paramecium tetraurelia TaxID=5888 RepID=A0CA39_PARTE|nr:uncharacterized protein GSPATT00036435001 [Paramecium tetraurelia]CAK67656.1 unnamed protein product [Paramecium tetraurelia]|eukprot:XP_001435053.1 hypothetical protein (macronuclear) [Paramecium tetraurelia strain d4-2]
MSNLTSNRFHLPCIASKEVSPKKEATTTRAMRPSLFLNQLDVLPYSLKTEGEVTERNVGNKIYTQCESDPLIEIPYHFRLPKIVPARPKRFQRSLPEIPIIVQESRNASPAEFERHQKRTKLFLKRQDSKILAPVTKFQRKKVEFKKSLIVIDIETGNQDKQEISETQKPLRRIAHQKTKSFQIRNE